MCLGEGSFGCSLNLSPKVLEVSPLYSSSHLSSPLWNQKMALLLFSMRSLSLGAPGSFNVAVAVEVGLYAILNADLFDAFAVGPGCKV